MKRELLAYFKKIGKRGGLAAAKNMTPVQRKARATKAVAVREAKRKASK